MFHESTFEDFVAADSGRVTPVVRERSSDLITPVGAAMRLFTPGEPACLLESAEGGETVGALQPARGDSDRIDRQVRRVSR